jgi:hypothetical protein
MRQGGGVYTQERSEEASVIRDAAKRLIQKAEEYEHHAAKALSPAVSEILINLAWSYRACAKRLSFKAEGSHPGKTDDPSKPA